jgi:hypothetical protein
MNKKMLWLICMLSIMLNIIMLIMWYVKFAK